MNENVITDQGAVTLEEGQLDAAGGLSLNFSKIEYKGAPAPTEKQSLNFTKIEF